MRPHRIAALVMLWSAFSAQAADLFPLRDVRLGPSPFLDAQATDLRYLMAMEPYRLLAPFVQMSSHYLSAGADVRNNRQS